MFRDPKRAAIVDDDAGVRALVVRVLRNEGFEVDAYGSVEEALEGFAVSPAAFVVVDLMMPGGTGIDFARELRAMLYDATPPMALVSGSIDDLSDDELSLFDRCLAKPFSVSALRRVAHDLSRRARSLRVRSTTLTAAPGDGESDTGAAAG